MIRKCTKKKCIAEGYIGEIQCFVCHRWYHFIGFFGPVRHICYKCAEREDKWPRNSMMEHLALEWKHRRHAL